MKWSTLTGLGKSIFSPTLGTGVCILHEEKKKTKTKAKQEKKKELIRKNIGKPELIINDELFIVV